jgi:ubiquinone/menaquinone biosynthesis C-methylase UbiE
MEFRKTPGRTDSTFWESVRRESQWGKYLTTREDRALVHARQLVGAPSVALEIGCDGGYWSRQLAECGWRMICSDVNADSLDLVRRRIPTATCVRVDSAAHSLPCATASIAMIVCIEVFEVVNAEWFPGEAARVLKPGGVIVGVVNNRLSWRGQAYRVMRVLDPKRRTYSEDLSLYKYTYNDWKRRFAAEGFRMAHEEGLAWLPFPRKSNSTLIPALTRMEQAVGLTDLPNLSPWVTFVVQKK